MKKFLLSLAAFVAITASAADNYVLKLSQPTAKANPWDTQVFINIKNLEPGEKYTVEFEVKGDEAYTLGSETIDDAQTEHMTEWNASAVFNYTEEIKVTSEWSGGLINVSGVTNVTCHSHCTPKGDAGISHENGNTSTCTPEVINDFKYAPTAILLNVGKVVGDLLIDNVTVKNSAGEIVYVETFDDNASVAAYEKSANAYFPGWQNANWEIAKNNADGTLEPEPEVTEPEVIIIAESADMKEFAWDSQFFIILSESLQGGEKYEMTMTIKADREAKIGAQYHKEPGDYLHHEAIISPNFTEEWAICKSSGTIPAAAAGAKSIAFQLNDYDKANKYYFGNISIKIDGKEIYGGTASKYDGGAIVGLDAVAAEAEAVAYDLFGNAGATEGFMVKGGKKVYVK